LRNWGHKRHSGTLHWWWWWWWWWWFERVAYYLGIQKHGRPKRRIASHRKLFIISDTHLALKIEAMF
jgi:hypothetical protein